MLVDFRKRANIIIKLLPFVKPSKLKDLDNQTSFFSLVCALPTLSKLLNNEQHTVFLNNHCREKLV